MVCPRAGLVPERYVGIPLGTCGFDDHPANGSDPTSDPHQDGADVSLDGFDIHGCDRNEEIGRKSVRGYSEALPFLPRHAYSTASDRLSPVRAASVRVPSEAPGRGRPAQAVRRSAERRSRRRRSCPGWSWAARPGSRRPRTRSSASASRSCPSSAARGRRPSRSCSGCRR